MHVTNLWNALWTNSDTTYCYLLQTNIFPAHHLIPSHIVFEVSPYSQCVLMHCGSVLCSQWHADSWASVWVSPTLPYREQASALTPHISLTLMDTCSLCAWQDVLLRKLNKNGNSDEVDTHTDAPQTPTSKNHRNALIWSNIYTQVPLWVLVLNLDIINKYKSIFFFIKLHILNQTQCHKSYVEKYFFKTN